RAVRGQAAAERSRQRPRRPQLRLRPPEMEVLERSLREVLSLGNAANLAVPLQKTRAYPPLAELDRQAQSDGTTADDDHGRIDAVQLAPEVCLVFLRHQHGRSAAFMCHRQVVLNDLLADDVRI